MLFRSMEFEFLGEYLAGPSAFAISYEDVTAPARVINKSINDFKKMAFKAAVVEGEFYDVSEMKSVGLFRMPPGFSEQVPQAR